MSEADNPTMDSAELNEKIQGDFDRARYALLDLYHSYIQNHAGYLIAIAIGSLTLASRWDIFFDSPPRYVSVWMGIIFDLTLSAILGLSIYVILRLTFWTKYANYMLGIQRITAEKDYEQWCSHEQKERQKKGETFPLAFYQKAPFSLKLTLAATQYLTYKKRILSFHKTEVFFCTMIPFAVLFLILLFSNILHIIF